MGKASIESYKPRYSNIFGIEDTFIGIGQNQTLTIKYEHTVLAKAI